MVTVNHNSDHFFSSSIRSIKWVCLFMSLFAGIASPIPAHAGKNAQIKLYTETQIDSETIQLAQISTIETSDPQIFDKLANVVVGRSPLPGSSTYIHPSEVELGLKKSKIDVDATTIIATGPVKVTRSHSTVSPERIKEAVIKYILDYSPWSKDQLKIRPINYTQGHIVPPGQVTLKVTAPKHTDWLGGIPFQVKIKVDGQIVNKTTVATYIEVWQDVILAAKPLGNNQPITKSDIKIESMNLTRVPKNAVLSTDQVIGYRANRSIAINSVLRVDQIEMPLVVRRGDLVQALVETKALRVTTNAIAKQDGRVGERIRLINVRSKKALYGQVVDSQTVKVEF